MSTHLFAGFRPVTLVAYHRMFNEILTFLILVGLWLPQVSTPDIFAFMEYLVQVGFTASDITIISQLSGPCALYMAVIPPTSEISPHL